MIWQEFISHFDRLVKWCGKPADKMKDQAETFFDRIRFIPSEAWPWIVDGYLDAHEPYSKLPTPAWVKECYQAWLERNPHKRKPPRAKTWCVQCRGKGFMDLLKETEPTNTEIICRCGHCDNWEDSIGISVPRWTRWEAAEQGWVILTQPGERGDDQVIDVRKLILFPRIERSYEIGPVSEPIRHMVEVEEEELPPF